MYSLELSQIQAAICQRPFESQKRKIRILTIVCAVITNTAVLVRFATRIGLHQTFSVDDWFIAATIVSLYSVLNQIVFSNLGTARWQMPSLPISLYNVGPSEPLQEANADELAVEHGGFGEHVWNIKLDDVPHLFHWCKFYASSHIFANIRESISVRCYTSWLLDLSKDPYYFSTSGSSQSLRSGTHAGRL